MSITFPVSAAVGFCWAKGTALPVRQPQPRFARPSLLHRPHNLKRLLRRSRTFVSG